MCFGLKMSLWSDALLVTEAPENDRSAVCKCASFIQVTTCVNLLHTSNELTSSKSILERLLPRILSIAMHVNLHANIVGHLSGNTAVLNF